MRVEHFDLALRHHPQHLLLHLRHGRRRHQREGQRKHCGSEPTPRPDRHGTLLYVVASIVVGYYSIGEGTPAPASRLEVSDGTAQRAEVWAIERVKTTLFRRQAAKKWPLRGSLKRAAGCL